jgi:hypothetical protein
MEQRIDFVQSLKRHIRSEDQVVDTVNAPILVHLTPWFFMHLRCSCAASGMLAVTDPIFMLLPMPW